MRLGLFFNHELKNCVKVANIIRSAFSEGCGVELVTGYANADLGEIDCAISIGGDGTFLLTARTIMGKGIPLYGVAAGRLGFLAYGDADSAVDDIRRIVAHDYEVFPIMPLKAEIVSDGGAAAKLWAFNEIMIVKKFVSRPIAISTYLGDEQLYSFLSDGIIVSTPVGSTAYALSAGGPIIHPEVGCASIVPICAHSLAPRPVLVPCETAINIKLDLAPDGAILSGDGRDGADLSSDDEVRVTSDPDARVDVIRMRGGTYTSVLRKKLKLS